MPRIELLEDQWISVLKRGYLCRDTENPWENIRHLKMWIKYTNWQENKFLKYPDKYEKHLVSCLLNNLNPQLKLFLKFLLIKNYIDEFCKH